MSKNKPTERTNANGNIRPSYRKKHRYATEYEVADLGGPRGRKAIGGPGLKVVSRLEQYQTRAQKKLRGK